MDWALLSLTSIQNEFNWFPSVNFEEGLKELICCSRIYRMHQKKDGNLGFSKKSPSSLYLKTRFKFIILMLIKKLLGLQDGYLSTLP